MYNEEILDIYDEELKDVGPWKVFAIIGLILSIIALVLGPISVLFALFSDYDAYIWYLTQYNDQLLANSYIFFTALEISYGLTFGAAGLILSILGKKSTKQKGKAVKGIIISVIGLALNIIALLIMLFGIAIAASSL